MSIINAATLETGNLKGAEHGATISLILDESEPGHGPRLHRHPTTRPGSSKKETSFSSSETSA